MHCIFHILPLFTHFWLRLPRWGPPRWKLHFFYKRMKLMLIIKIRSDTPCKKEYNISQKYVQSYESFVILGDPGRLSFSFLTVILVTWCCTLKNNRKFRKSVSFPPGTLPWGKLRILQKYQKYCARSTYVLVHYFAKIV